MICKNENVPHYCTDFDFLGGDNQKCRFYIGVVEVLDEKSRTIARNLTFWVAGSSNNNQHRWAGQHFVREWRQYWTRSDTPPQRNERATLQDLQQ